MVPNVTGPVLMFFTVTVCGALVPPLAVLKVRVAGLTVMGLVTAAADEVSFTTSGTALGASSVMMMEPSTLADVGVTCTLTVQFPAGAMVVVKQVPVLIW